MRSEVGALPRPHISRAPLATFQAAQAERPKWLPLETIVVNAGRRFITLRVELSDAAGKPISTTTQVQAVLM